MKSPLNLPGNDAGAAARLDRPVIEGLVETLTRFADEHRAWAPALVLVLAFGESIAFVSLILPFWGILVAVGALFTGSPLEFVAIWIGASIGAALGDWVSYWIGAHFGDRVAGAWPLSRYPGLLPRGRAFFDRYGAWAVVLGRFSGPFRASVPIVAGIARMNRLTFQIANWGSAFLWALVLLLFGDAIGRIITLVSQAIG